MKKGGVFWSIILLLLIFQEDLNAQKDPEKLFLSIKELSSSDPELAEKKIKQYIQLGVETKNPKIAGQAFYLLGRINYFKSRNYISNEYYALAIHSAHAKKELSFAESCWNNMGVNYEMQNLIPEAMNAYQKSLQYAEQLKDSTSIAQSWINIGLLSAKVTKFDQARKLTQQALDFFRRKKDNLNLALCYQNLGFIMSEENNHAGAIQYYFKCLFINKKVDNQFEILNLMFNIGSNYSDLDMNYNAEKYLQESLHLAFKQDRKDVIAKVYIQRGENATKAGDYKGAEKNFTKARKLIEENKIFELEWLLFRGFSHLYAKSGDFDAYMKTVDEIHENVKKRSFMESVARADEVQSLYEFQKNVHQIRIQENNIQETRKQTYILAILSAFLTIVLTIVIFQHLKALKYMRSLFESKVEKTLQHFPDGETVSANKIYLKDVYQKISDFTEKSGNREIDLSVLSKEFGIREEYIAQSIRMFAENDRKHVFFQTFFIDELCKQMITSGSNISLRNITDHSPFATFGDFTKHFREVTGLKPEQFLRYCDARLKEKRKQHS